MNLPHDRMHRALDEVRRVRDQVRVRMHLLGMEASDALVDAEELLHLVERRLRALAGRVRPQA